MKRMNMWLGAFWYHALFSEGPYVLDDETLPYMYIFGEVGDMVGASKTRSWGIFYISIWIGLDKILSLCSQFSGCQINLWITLDKILSIVFLCSLTVHDNKDAMIGGNKNLKLK